MSRCLAVVALVLAMAFPAGAREEPGRPLAALTILPLSQIELVVRNRHFAAMELYINALISRSTDETYSQALSSLYEHLGTMNGIPALLDEWEKQNSGFHGIPIIRGYFYIMHAWKYRGGSRTKTAAHETEDSFKVYMGHAREQLGRAYVLNPNDLNSSLFMITVAMAAGDSYEDMERHFQRVMRINPHNYEAHYRKAYYLSPRWRGTRKKLFAFARKCAAKGKHNRNLYLIMSDAHYLEFLQSKNLYGYYRDTSVWNDVQTTYVKALAAHPDFDLIHCLYSLDAFWAGRHDIERREFWLADLANHPQLLDRFNEIAWLLATDPDPDRRNGGKALQYATKVSGVKASPEYLDTLAAANAELGDFTSAVKIQKLAMSEIIDPVERRSYEFRLKLYENRQPYRLDMKEPVAAGVHPASP